VLDVVDGDTITVWYQDHKETVRLIGVDTPESKINAKLRKDCERLDMCEQEMLRAGSMAKWCLLNLYIRPSERTVRLEFDKQERDRYGRLLAYVYARDGSMINIRLVEDCIAVPMEVKPNLKFADQIRTTWYKKVRLTAGDASYAAGDYIISWTWFYHGKLKDGKVLE